MVNRILFSDYNSSDKYSDLINTKYGHRLLVLLEEGPLALSQIKERFNGSSKDLMITLSQFLSIELASHQNGMIGLTIPVITGDEQEEYLLRLEPLHRDLCHRIRDLIHSSFYMERLSLLKENMDFDLIDLNFLLVACFGMLWGGKNLFMQLAESNGSDKIILLDERELGLCQSMSSFTDRYTFSSFGYAEDIFRDTIGNLLNQPLLIQKASSLVGGYLEKEYERVIQVAVDSILDKIGDSLLTIKEGSSLNGSIESQAIEDLLGALSYIQQDRVLVPIFMESHNTVLYELIIGFQEVLAKWYLEEGCSCFALKKNGKTIDPGISWFLQIGQMNALLIQENSIFFPHNRRYMSMVFNYSAVKAREIFKQYRWEEKIYERR